MKAFFLTAGTEAYAKKVSIIQPLVRDSKTAELSHSSNLGFLLWDTFLVFPILEESGLVKLYFPKGKWVYYFNRSKIYNGESVDIRAFDLS